MRNKCDIMKQILIKKSMLLEMARPKVERTIDPRIWAAMASLCSRTYKSDLGEFAKPLGTTKDVIMARYVSGLIIMKQPCPASANDIDEIKALKQYGHKLVDELHVPIEEIQTLYNQNCGNLPKAEIKKASANNSTGGFFNQANIDKLKQTKKPSLTSIAKKEIRKYITFTYVAHHTIVGKIAGTEQTVIAVILKGSDNLTYFSLFYHRKNRRNISIADYVVDNNKVHMIKSKDSEELRHNMLEVSKKYINDDLTCDIDDCELSFITNDFYELYEIIEDGFKEILNFLEDHIDGIDTTQNTRIEIGTPLYANLYRKEKGYGQEAQSYSIDDISGKEVEFNDYGYTYKSIKVGECIDISGSYYKFLLDVNKVVTSVERSSSMSRSDNYYSKGVKPLYSQNTITNYVPKYKIPYYTTAADAKKDFDGIMNSILLSNNFNNYAFSYGGNWMLTGEYLRASWSYYNFNAISLKGGQYLPALGELIKLYKKTPAMQNLSGFWWSSTPADKTKFWAYDGSRVKALDIIKDMARVSPIIAIKKNNITLVRLNNYLQLIPTQIYRGDPTSFSKKPVVKLTLDDIKKKYNSLSLITPVLKKYMKEKVPMASENRYEFMHRDMFNNHWNYTINGIELYKNELFFNYWTGGDSTDEDGSISFYELPRYAGQRSKIYARHAGTTMTLEYEDMLLTAQKFLYEIIKKYGE